MLHSDRQPNRTEVRVDDVCAVRSLGAWGKWLGVFPHPRQLLGANYSDAERERIAHYIELTRELHYAKGLPVFGEDCYLHKDHPGLELVFKCDGYWLYPKSLEHYVRCGVRLPEQFLERVRSQDYVPPMDQVESSSVQSDEGGYWIWWSIGHSSFNWLYVVFLLRLLLFYPLRVIMFCFHR